MSVHMFRVYVAPDFDQTDLQTAIDDWVAGHTKWTDDPQETGVVGERLGDLEDPSTAYWGVDIRIEKTDTKANILQKLGDKLKNKCDWYRAGYHECTHDEDPPQPCSWEDRQDWTDKDVTIPSYVPGLT